MEKHFKALAVVFKGSEKKQTQAAKRKRQQSPTAQHRRGAREEEGSTCRKPQTLGCCGNWHAVCWCTMVWATGALRCSPLPPPPPHPTRSWGPKCLKDPDRRCQKILVPHLKGLVKQVAPCVYIQKKCSVFLGIFPGPQEGRVCAAFSDFVPLLGITEKVGIM